MSRLGTADRSARLPVWRWFPRFGKHAGLKVRMYLSALSGEISAFAGWSSVEMVRDQRQVSGFATVLHGAAVFCAVA